MVGICGVIGETTPDLDSAIQGLEYTGSEVVHKSTGDEYEVAVVEHPSLASKQPVGVEAKSVKIWLWGSIFGFDNGGYVPKSVSHPNQPSARYFADLYETYGLDILDGLNGEFVGLLYREDDGEVVFFTDRLSSRPLFYSVQPNDSIMFSSNINSIAALGSGRLRYRPEYLQEYISMGRVYGTKTPFAGIEQLSPSAATWYDLSSNQLQTNSYWDPRYRPKDKPASYFAAELASRLQVAIDDRTYNTDRNSLLLSGGSDSRLLLATLGTDLDKAYHMNDWICREAKIAERMAIEMDIDFNFLKRDFEYIESVLETAPAMNDFIGRFSDAHAAGFAERFRDEAGFVFHGTYSDPLFKNEQLPQKLKSVSDIGLYQLPLMADIEDLDDYVSYRSILRGGSMFPTQTPDFYRSDQEMRSILADNMDHRKDGTIMSHGVKYESLNTLIQSHEYYPLTNYENGFFHFAAMHSHPIRTPFLDNRLIDLHLKMPRKYQLQKNMVAEAIKECAPSLAEYPYTGSGNSGIPLKYPFYLHYVVENVGDLFTRTADRYLPGRSDASESRLAEGSWMDYDGLIRESDFVARNLEKNGELIQQLPFIDENMVGNYYRQHLAGASRGMELFILLTLLNMPAVQNDERIASSAGTEEVSNS